MENAVPTDLVAHSHGASSVPGSDFIAGIFGGYGIMAFLALILSPSSSCKNRCAGVLAGHPFDTVKTRGLYKGMVSPLFGVALINSLLFGVYGWALDRLSLHHPNDPPISSIFLAGSFSGLVNAFFSCPMELVKIRLQNQGSNGTKHLYTGPLDCATKIVKSMGLKGLYRGFGTTLIRETPSYGVYFASYEIMSRALTSESDGNETISSDFSLGLLAAGGLAGVIGWGSTYPFDVAKTRIQSAENQTNPAYKGVFRTFSTMYRQSGGYGVFFSGLGATTLRAFPTNACTFYTVLWVKKYLDEN